MDTISAITRLKGKKRHSRNNDSQTRTRSNSEQELSPQNRPHESVSQDKSKGQSATGLTISDNTSFTSNGLDGTETSGTHLTEQALEQIVKVSLHNNEFESTFGESCIIREEQAETTEDNLPDEDETRMAQEWSKATHSQTYLVGDEDEYSTTSAPVEIIGVECKTIGNGVQWWYRTQPTDMTLRSDYCAELNTPFGNARLAHPLNNGYHYVQFSPTWVRCHKVPKAWKADLWKAIGPKFWSLPAPCSDAKWDATENLYLSETLSIHLCGEIHCEECQSRYGDLVQRVETSNVDTISKCPHNILHNNILYPRQQCRALCLCAVSAPVERDSRYSGTDCPLNRQRGMPSITC